MNAALEALLAQGSPEPEAIDAFIAGHDFPLVAKRGVTFVYRGEADAVLLRHFIFGLPTSQPLERVDGTDLWHLELELPERSRLEYKFDVVHGENNRWILDPLNPQTAADPFGANSVARAYGYERPGWTRPDPEALPGSIERVACPSRAFAGERELARYVPARFRRNRRYPLLVVHDGDDFLRFADLKIVLDNLIHRLEIPPLIAALTSSPRRLVEYAGDPRHARFLTEDVLPWLGNRLPPEDAPAPRCLMGASYGGVASLYTAWRYPGVWGKLLLQSGSFAFTDIGGHKRGAAFDPVVRFVNAFRKSPGLAARRLFVSCGVYESLIYENRSLVPLLQRGRQRSRLRYVEVRDGHNWENWRDRLQDGLSWLYPGPLWMVYE